MKKNKAFTLAETLVVMGIIGVIAALTVPNLSQATGNREKITRVQKAYSNLVEAIDRATAIYGPFASWNFPAYSSGNTTDIDNFIGDRVTEFMKLSKNCRADRTCVTLTENYPYYHFQLADGTFISLATSKYGITFDIATRKRSEKSIDGKNTFRGTLWESNGEMVLAGNSKDFDYIKSAVNHCVNGGESSADGDFVYCRDGSLIWLLRYGNIDYLKFTSAGKCPNGSTPTESNPRCN